MEKYQIFKCIIFTGLINIFYHSTFFKTSGLKPIDISGCTNATSFTTKAPITVQTTDAYEIFIKIDFNN